jgi:hypothetical protein
MGHYLDDHLRTGRVSKDYLRHRVGDEPLKSMRDFSPDYRADEVGRDDEFLRTFGVARTARYAGKEYHGDDTELTSLGFERLYQDSVGLAARDPEYTALILGLLDGSLRLP